MVTSSNGKTLTVSYSINIVSFAPLAGGGGGVAQLLNVPSSLPVFALLAEVI